MTEISDLINAAYNRDDGQKVYDKFISTFQVRYCKFVKDEAKDFVDKLLVQCIPSAAALGIPLGEWETSGGLLNLAKAIVYATQELEIFDQDIIINSIRKLLINKMRAMNEID